MVHFGSYLEEIGLNIFISENNIHGNYNYCYIHKHNRIRTKKLSPKLSKQSLFATVENKNRFRHW